MRDWIRIVVLAAVVLFIVWRFLGRPQHSTEADQPLTARAVAVLHPTEGCSAGGMVTFTRTDEGIRIVAHLHGLEPGPHGFHIHEYGDCSAPDGTSAGGHFNPTGAPHGGPADDQRHLGDLGNVTADESGHASLEVVDAHLSLEGPHSILGRAVVLHTQADDLTSQPSGAAGARIACGVIGLARE
ncbi:MAG: superoxide dismutase family protein [Candidatus Neomarinimicrobiota bacterium]